MRKKLLVVGILVLAIILGLVIIQTHRKGNTVQAQLVSAASPADISGFTRADGTRPLSFPADYGPHPDFQTEWWYYTGNLDAPTGQHFGYQLTFFRRALQPPADRQQRSSDWATNQVYMAHFALTDVAGGRYQAFERLQRGAAGLAGAQAEPFQVWLEDWSVEETAPHVYLLHAAQGDLQLDLTLADPKGPILQGDQGYSQKGPQPGQASYYYSLTDLVSDGTVQVGKDSYTLHGLSWMDHEFSTSALASDQVGWDWFSIQLNDGNQLMVFQIRKADGSIDPYSSGTWISKDGETRHLTRAEFDIQPLASWKSPHSGATYPAGWSVKVPQLGLSLKIEPWLADQELNVSYSYWEGAVRIQGQRQGQPVGGNGYVELTGYNGSMSGQF
jgi:predicted secreted hydrolase